MRSRSWRRYKEECKVIHRLKKHKFFYYIRDASNNRIQNATWLDMIGSSHHHMYKTYTTKRYDSEDKAKWGKSGKSRYSYSNDPWTRVKDKQRFLRDLEKEYGIKHFNVSYGFIQANTEQE